MSRRLLLLPGLLLLASWTLAGCTPKRIPPATFLQAQRVRTTVTVQGALVRSSLQRNSGQPVRFKLTEATSGTQMEFEAPPTVDVPANITSSESVSVTGAWDPGRSLFVAESVVPAVPGREYQPRG